MKPGLLFIVGLAGWACVAVAAVRLGPCILDSLRTELQLRRTR
jgi:hypothetical protein